MGRIVFVLLVFATVINPELRARVQPHVQWMLDPVFEWSARSRVHEISRALEAESSLGRPIPTSSTLPAFLRRHYKRDDATVDPWNVHFYLARDTWTVRVASAGRDQQPFTADDILSPPVEQAQR